MNKVVGLLSLCVACAILKVILIALAITLVLGLLYAFAKQPRETLLFVGVLTVTGLAGAQPAAFIAAVGIICVTAIIAAGGGRRRADESPSQDQPAPPLIDLEPRSKA